MKAKTNRLNLGVATALAIAIIVALNSAILGLAVAIIITTALCLVNRN